MPTPNESMDTPNAFRVRKRRSLRLMLIMLATTALLMLLAAIVSTISKRAKLRFDPSMPTNQAEIIRDQAADADDAETWLAIHEEILWPRYVAEINTSWTSLPRRIRRDFSLSKAMEKLERDRYFASVEQVAFYGRALSPIQFQNKPRIVQACVDQMAILMSQLYPNPHAPPHVLGESLNERLRMYLERQGRMGDASDQAWFSFLDMFSPAILESWIRLHSSGSALFQHESWRENLAQQHNKYPDNPWFARLKGVIRSRDGQFAEAEPLLAKAADLFADDPEGRHAWAEARLALNLPVDVESIMGPPCRPSIHFETQEAMRLTLRAQLHVRQGHFEAALRDAEAAVALDPRGRQAWEVLAEVTKITGDTDRSHLAETQARNWSEKENRLQSDLRAFATRVQEVVSKDRRMLDDGGTAAPLVEALEAIQWPLAADALRTQRKIGAKEIEIPAIRKITDFRTNVPDRFFQPRPVLQSDSPDSPGLGGVRL